jgi:superfamily II DNA or RNA helicase
LVGRVRGSARRPYTVIIHHVAASGGAPGPAFGECTCPVHINCKHVAAVMHAAGRRSAVTGPALAPAPWEAVLGTALEGAGASPDEPSIGVLIEPTFDKPGQCRLRMRPVVRNERGRWIHTGISWSDASYGYGYRQRPGSAMRLLAEISALDAAGGSRSYYYGSRDSVIELASFPSGRIWDVFAQARSAGLALLGSSDGTPVVLAAGGASAGIDIAERDGDWVLSPTIVVNGAPIGAPPILVGEPAHGVAWLSEPEMPQFELAASPGTVARPAARPASRLLHLARLDRPLSSGISAMISAGDPIVVPPADQQRFGHRYLPLLQRRLAVASGDRSVTIPQRQPPRLALVTEHDAADRIAVAWEWRYPCGDEAIRIPLTEPGAQRDLRDPDAESPIRSAAIAAVRTLPPLCEWTPLGPQLAPTATLIGSEAIRFQRDVLPRLSSVPDVDVEIGEGVVELREAQAAPVIAIGGSAENGTDWFDLAVSVTVEGEQVPFGALFVALAGDEEYLILPSGTYFALDRDDLRQLRALIEESRSLTDADSDDLRVSRFQASFWAELEALGVLDEQATVWGRSVRELARCEDIPEPALPEGLQASLRPYQRVGFTWLSFLYDNGLGGVLADDMGLGKTVQALALITHAREEKPGGPPFLVVAPTSVVGNWVAECRRFAPELKALGISETEARRGIPLEEAVAGMDVVVTSYALFRLEYEEYERIGWSGLLVDEAQAIKNHQSKGFQCAKRLPAPFKLVITGTPMENNLMELWAMFSIAAPGLLGDPKKFTQYYRLPIERAGDQEMLAQLRRRIRPLMLRRTKEAVATDLPEKTEQVIELELERRHRRVYQRYLQRERQKVLGLLDDMNKNRFQIFRSLTLLRQAALDASLVGGDHATVPATKLDMLMEMLDSAATEGPRVLVFSQFTRFLKSAQQRLRTASIRHCYLDGSTRNRAQVLREFKTGDAPVFLISLKAGGVGLNLTEADYCILLDPWWNPATEAQAVDRTHRIGQDKPVMVYRLVAKDTIEEKVMALKARKAALFSSIMDDGGVGSGGLTAADIRGLLV